MFGLVKSLSRVENACNHVGNIPSNTMTRRVFLQTSLALGGILAGCSQKSSIQLPKGKPILPGTGCVFEALLGSGTPTSSQVTKFEQSVGKKLGGVMWFQSFLNTDFPINAVTQINENGYRVPIVKWGWEGDIVELIDLNLGYYDELIRKMARGAREAGTPFILVPLPEPDNSVNFWSGAKSGGTGTGPRRYIDAFTRIVRIFREEKANNIRIELNLGLEPDIKEDWNKPENYIPTNTKFMPDQIGITSYNGWKFKKKDGARLVEEVVRRFSQYKMPIGFREIGCGEGEIDKPKFIRSFFGRVIASPSIKFVCWFNFKKEDDWRISSSAAAFEAFSEQVRNNAIVSDFIIKN